MVNPELCVRPAVRDDLSEIRALLVETWHDTYDALLGAERVAEITDDWHSTANLERQLNLPDTCFLVAGRESRIVGHLFANAQKLPVLFVSRLYVLSAHQRRGIGTHLLAAAIARRPQAKMVRLEVEAGNPKGLAFYRGQGFRETGESLAGAITHIKMERILRG